MQVCEMADPARSFKAISEPTRVSILLTLLTDEMNVTGLREKFGMRQQAVSHHLTLLKLNGFVEIDRRGKCNFYRLTASGHELAQIALTQLKGAR